MGRNETKEERMQMRRGRHSIGCDRRRSSRRYRSDSRSLHTGAFICIRWARGDLTDRLDADLHTRRHRRVVARLFLLRPCSFLASCLSGRPFRTKNTRVNIDQTR